MQFFQIKRRAVLLTFALVRKKFRATPQAASFSGKEQAHALHPAGATRAFSRSSRKRQACRTVRYLTT